MNIPETLEQLLTLAIYFVGAMFLTVLFYFTYFILAEAKKYISKKILCLFNSIKSRHHKKHKRGKHKK